MTVRRRVRAAARRTVLVAEGTGLTATGRARTSQQTPGTMVLLLHNTPPDAIDRLLTHVHQNRDRYLDFDRRVTEPGSTSGVRYALSFDDGFVSNLDAGRRLAEIGLSAVFYVPTGVVGLPKHEVDRFFRRPQAEGVMTWKDLEELRALGHVVGSHCRHHVPMSSLSLAEAEDELKGSVAELRERLGPTEHFAWPFGSRNHAPVHDVVRWAREVEVVAASGVRGRNTPGRFATDGFLRRDAVDLKWLSTDLTVFSARDANGR